MKNKTLFIIIISVIAVLAFVVVLSSILPNKPKATITPEVKEPPKEVVTKPGTLITEKKDEKFYTITLEYPHSTREELREVGDYVAKVKADFLELSPKTEVEAMDIGITKDSPYILKMDTTVYNSPTTVTYKLETYIFTGGAHGGGFVSTFTYDKEGNLITLDDILKSPDALEKLSTAARTYLYKKLGSQNDREVINVGTEPKKDNFATWYITNSGITFVFQQYQIGPYALGIQEFPIGRSDAEALFNF